MRFERTALSSATTLLFCDPVNKTANFAPKQTENAMEAILVWMAETFVEGAVATTWIRVSSFVGRADPAADRVVMDALLSNILPNKD